MTKKLMQAWSADERKVLRDMWAAGAAAADILEALPGRSGDACISRLARDIEHGVKRRNSDHTWVFEHLGTTFQLSSRGEAAMDVLRLQKALFIDTAEHHAQQPEQPVPVAAEPEWRKNRHWDNAEEQAQVEQVVEHFAAVANQLDFDTLAKLNANGRSLSAIESYLRNMAMKLDAANDAVRAALVRAVARAVHKHRCKDEVRPSRAKAAPVLEQPAQPPVKTAEPDAVPEAPLRAAPSLDMAAERRSVLGMVRDGLITAADGAQLLRELR